MNTNNFKFEDLSWLQEKEMSLNNEISKLGLQSTNLLQLAFEIFGLLGYLHSYLSNPSMLAFYGILAASSLLLKWGVTRIKKYRLKIKKEAQLELIKKIKTELIQHLLKNLPKSSKNSLLSQYKKHYSHHSN